jgi:hypothetical protein
MVSSEGACAAYYHYSWKFLLIESWKLKIEISKKSPHHHIITSSNYHIKKC